MSYEIVDLLGNTAFQLSKEEFGEEAQAVFTPEGEEVSTLPNRFRQGFRQVRTVIGSSPRDFFAAILKKPGV